MASSFSFWSLAGELDDEWASRSFLRLCFPIVAAGFSCSSVASVVSIFSSSREVAEGTGESSVPLTSSSRTAVSALGSFSDRGEIEDSTEWPYKFFQSQIRKYKKSKSKSKQAKAQSKRTHEKLTSSKGLSGPYGVMAQSILHGSEDLVHVIIRT